MRIAALVMPAVLWIALDAFAQGASADQQQPIATVRGTVIDAGTGTAIPRARIEVRSGRGVIATVMSEEDGQFRVSVPAVGTPLFLASKAGYATLSQRSGPEHLRGAELRIELPRGAAISGRIVGASGPIGFPGLGVRRIGGAGTESTALVQVASDESGEFRIGGLPAGRYEVGEAPSMRLTGFRIVGPTVDLVAGAEVSGIELRFERVDGSGTEPPRGPVPTGSAISGTVTTTAGLPISGATVSARAGTGQRNATTDERGQFTIRGVYPGSVAVSAVKAGFQRSDYGQQGADLPGLKIPVEAGRDVENLSIVLPRRSTVSGMVLDDHGDPLQDATVHVLRLKRSPSGLVAVRDQPEGQRTDDRGHFKITLRPGDYLVTASLAFQLGPPPPPQPPDPGATRKTAYVPTYYPDAIDIANASTVRIGVEEDVAGVIIAMRRVPVVRVDGVVGNSQGDTFAGTVRLTPRRTGLVAPDPRIVRPDPNGRFVFGDVPPGDYIVQASAASGPAGSEFAVAPLTVVDSDPPPLALRTVPAASVSGRVVLEDGTGGEVLWGYAFSTAPIDGSVASPGTSNLGGPVSTGEPFQMRGLAGPTRVRVWSDDENWYLKSVLVNGVDVADEPFDFGFDGRNYTDVDVVFSRAGASIAGRATDDRAAPLRDYAVYVFPIDRSKWVSGSRWIKLARAAADGAFKVGSLPPGDYMIAAVDRVDPVLSSDELVDPDLLDTLAFRAIRATLGERQALDVTLRVIRR